MILLKWFAIEIPGMVIGIVIGSFMPGIGRRIKGWFTKEGQAVKQKISR